MGGDHRRRLDKRGESVGRTGENRESVGVEYGGERGRQNRLDLVDQTGVGAGARTDEGGVEPPCRQQRRQTPRVLQAMNQGAWLVQGVDRPSHRRHRQTGQAKANAPGRRRRQARRAGHGGAPDDEAMATMVFVIAQPRRRHRRPPERRRVAPLAWLNGGQHTCLNANVDDREAATQPPPRQQEMTRFGTKKADGLIGLKGGATHLAGVAIDARRHVHGEHRQGPGRTAGVGGGDEGGGRAGQGPAQTGAKQRIDQDRRPLQRRHRQRLDRPAPGRPHGAGGPLTRCAQRGQTHGPAGRR